MNKDDIQRTLAKHADWLSGKDAGMRADLRGADLREADLREADLWKANLGGSNLGEANLWGANLRGANLQRADLQRTNLREANLRGADLREANLWGADLRGSNLREANLWEANLLGANLQRANLQRADLEPVAAARLSTCPPDGPFYGWKKCQAGVIVKVCIPDNARRSSATTRKCRAEFVDVLEVIGADVGVSKHNGATTYRSGERVTCDKWDEDRWAECSGGIHFFLTREEAEAY